jgi:hypothetical protein
VIDLNRAGHLGQQTVGVSRRRLMGWSFIRRPPGAARKQHQCCGRRQDQKKTAESPVGTTIHWLQALLVPRLKLIIPGVPAIYRTAPPSDLLPGIGAKAIILKK